MVGGYEGSFRSLMGKIYGTARAPSHDCGKHAWLVFNFSSLLPRSHLDSVYGPEVTMTKETNSLAEFGPGAFTKELESCYKVDLHSYGMTITQEIPVFGESTAGRLGEVITSEFFLWWVETMFTNL